jgi:RNA-directed DNA polymerase
LRRERVAQTVATAPLEKAVEPRFHPDSYGYRPGRSALDAARVCRKRCREYNWVIDLDIRKFFDSVRWDLTVEAVEAHTDHETRCAAAVGDAAPPFRHADLCDAFR